jgi:hypothetical protein
MDPFFFTNRMRWLPKESSFPKRFNPFRIFETVKEAAIMFVVDK